MHDLMEFILEKIPVGAIVLNSGMKPIYKNRKAEKFLDRFDPPGEIHTISRRIFSTLRDGNFRELFPGEIFVTKKYDDSPSTWIFRFFVCEQSDPYVCVFIIEETISNTLDLNKIRQQFRLTRRETDVLRRLLDGMKNIEISEELKIAEQTVKDHLSKIYMKTGTENRFALLNELIKLKTI